MVCLYLLRHCADSHSPLATTCRRIARLASESTLTTHHETTQGESVAQSDEVVVVHRTSPFVGLYRIEPCANHVAGPGFCSLPRVHAARFVKMGRRRNRWVSRKMESRWLRIDYGLCPEISNRRCHAGPWPQDGRRNPRGLRCDRWIIRQWHCVACLKKAKRTFELHSERKLSCIATV